uniref:ATP synthase F0 subunit 8 n=1 Tax=Theopropus sinecus TaxID=2908872 RepID=UPI001C342556|nr:ATP synthase F0 subunit 8 [Theopropus cattulus]
MPQMMPLNWFMLFLLFSIVLMLFNMMNYYMPYYKTTFLTQKKMKTKFMFWKW